VPTWSTQSSNAVSERRPADAVQREVERVVGGRQHVGDLHRQVDVGVQRGTAVLLGPQRQLVLVEQVDDGVGQLEADGRTADDDQHDGQLTLGRLERRR